MPKIYNFKSNYSTSELINYITDNPRICQKIIKYNLDELGKLKSTSKLWFDVDKGKIHIDKSNIAFRQFNRLFSTKKGYNQTEYLKAFKIFAETYFSLVPPDPDQIEVLTADLDRASQGLKQLKNRSAGKLGKLFDKLAVDLPKKAELMQTSPLDYLELRGKYWKNIADWKSSKADGKEKIIKEAYFSAKFLLQKNYHAVLLELDTKASDWHQLFQDLLEVAPRSSSITEDEFNQSLLAEFLLSIDKASKFKGLIEALNNHETLKGHSEKEIKKLKQAEIWKSGLLHYTPGIIPKDKISKPIIPPGVRARGIIKGIAKVTAGGLTLTAGILFPPLLIFAGVGIKLASDGVKLVLNKKGAHLYPEKVLKDIIKAEKTGQDVKKVKNLGEGIVQFINETNI